jgi:hypothetical protein
VQAGCLFRANNPSSEPDRSPMSDNHIQVIEKSAMRPAILFYSSIFQEA